MVTVYNPENEAYLTHVKGAEIVVPARGSVLVTEKQLRALLEQNKKLTVGVDRGYDDADFATMRTLTKARLQGFCETLMRGARLAVADFAQGGKLDGDEG